MGKINVLEKQVAELIAAGEVVERPASVIKELVENSIDAGAGMITVEIKHGGITFIRITDNGCGIVREDVPVAFLRHATSKVLKQGDLESIGTLGFRGEALASICAVAKVELLTRTVDELAGTRYQIEGGVEQCCEDAGCPQGTTILVRDIFYNVPARMKFLKKDVTEANAIAGILDKIALSHSEVSLKFIRDGKEELNTPGDGKLKSAVYAVYGKEFTSGLIPVDYEYNGIKVWGFVSKPTCARPNRSMQNFFINGRFVKSQTAMVALEQAFKGSVMVGKFPACVLHMELAFQAVDVNVHPAKLEVRFVNERPIFDAIYHGVKSALNKEDAPNRMLLNTDTPKKPLLSPFSMEKKPIEQIELQKPSAPVTIIQPIKPKANANVYHRNLSFLDIEVDEPIEKTKPFDKEPTQSAEKMVYDKSCAPIPSCLKTPITPLVVHDSAKPMYEYKDRLTGGQEVKEQAANLPQCSAKQRSFEESLENSQPEKQEKFIGQAFGTYIILERGKDELVFIDKHAAHERMLYEKLKAQGTGSNAQMLLQPVTVTLDKNEYSAVLNSIDIYSAAGFEIEDFGGGTVLVRSAPLSLNGSDVADAVMEIAGYLHSSKTDITTEQLDWLYHNIACRAAIKGGDESSSEELIALAKRLEQNPDIRYCPHGRPISIVLKKHEIEKQFGRV